MSDLKIFTDNIEPEALNQIYTLVKQPVFADCKVRIMPDVHAGAGCVIGFTADLGDKVIPNIVGVDIGCGMRTVELGQINIDFAALDSAIREHIPSGREVRKSEYVRFEMLDELRCYRHLKDIDRIKRSIGTLGGGNHFIEIDMDEYGNKFLIIHTGSRNLGKQVAEYYQALAVETMSGKDLLYKRQEQLIAEYTAQGRKKEIEKAIRELHRKFSPNPLGIPKELCYLTGENREDYLHDMRICQRYAALNRYAIAETILDVMGWNHWGGFETIHNYIDLETNMVRKGAISAKAGELLLIPINMRDGSLICIGKGNEEWNCSAPHGAGRLMSRHAAFHALSMEEFQKEMEGIYTTCVLPETLDESPMAYKSMAEIIDQIEPTVEIVQRIRPVYNFKASD